MNFTMNFSPGYKFINRFEGSAQWYMMETKDDISSIPFDLKNEKTELVFFQRSKYLF